ncbi:MAG TPA: MBL fold metallo-hydrolase [Syntrophales bacterium]|nr:MBL fold metallo-hydrolase [Syntrophales bacterium]HPQ42776.1 MBL fold metallo-hydrolase [Syntrophales bacterium]
MVNNIFWLGHSSVRIDGEKVIYIDPWKLKDVKEADIILVSHSHHDHLSVEDIKKIQKNDTIIITTPDCTDGLTGDIRVVKPGDVVQIGEISVEAVPSYNVDKAFHPKENNWLGFVVTVGGKRIYYCGDTDLIPEMESIEADIMLVPVGGTYTMTAEEAARAVNMIKPKIAIPIHYDDIVGTEDDAKRFKGLCEVPVDIKHA